MQAALHSLTLWTLRGWEVLSRRLRRDDGFSTAELLGNAALGILALVAIWTVLSDQGSQLVTELLSRVSGP